MNKDNEYFQYFRKKAEKGSPEAQYKLGNFYWQEKNFNKAGYWHALAAEQWEKKAEEGDKQSQYRIAHCYFNADGVFWSNKKALYWLKKAAELNHTQAQSELSKHYIEGYIVTKNIFKALYWYIKSTKKSNFSNKIKLISAFIKDYYDKYCIFSRKKRNRLTTLMVLAKMYEYRILRPLCRILAEKYLNS